MALAAVLVLGMPFGSYADDRRDGEGPGGGGGNPAGWAAVCPTSTCLRFQLKIKDIQYVGIEEGTLQADGSFKKKKLYKGNVMVNLVGGQAVFNQGQALYNQVAAAKGGAPINFPVLCQDPPCTCTLDPEKNQPAYQGDNNWHDGYSTEFNANFNGGPATLRVKFRYKFDFRMASGSCKHP